MVRLLLGIFRDLYVVLLIIFIIEQIPGNDLLHDMTRKGVVTVTVCIVVVKVLQPFFDVSSGTGRSPRRQKKTEAGKSATLEWAASEMQGWRPAMEDATCIVAALPAPLANQSLFAVFDGHGGSQVSLLASREFPKVLSACAQKAVKDKALQSGNSSDSDGEADAADFKETSSHCGSAEGSVEGADDDAPKAEAVNGSDKSAGPQPPLGESLRVAMLAMDAVLQRKGASCSAHEEQSSLNGYLSGEASGKSAFSLVGSTAIIVLVECGDGSADPPARARRLTVANCGDSRAVLCRKGTAMELSEDHKPELPREEERIRKAGGHVAMIGPCHRIDGWGLNLSRALGDFHYKSRTDLGPDQQKVIAVPEIQTLDLTDDDEFLLLGCDGIFELNTSQKAVDIVREGLAQGLSTEKAVEDLVEKSCSTNLVKTRGKGGDNCSAIVVKLR